MKETAAAFERLVTIMEELREKCPWDKKQTIHTLRPMTIEETYELTDAIIKEDWQNIKEELGDLLLHIVFYAKIAAERQAFTLEALITAICDKLVLRHPHVYGNVQAADDDAVKRNWEAIKLKEGKHSVMAGVPASLPPVVKAARIQEKAKQVGFEWSNAADVWKKVEEEMGELQEAVALQNMQHAEEELGDVLFSVINYARFLHLDADAALEKVNLKFLNRFCKMEKLAMEAGKSLTDMNLEEMDALWDLIKLEK